MSEKFKFYVTIDNIKRAIYRVGKFRFVNGFFFTSDPELQKELEESPLFNVDYRLAKTKEVEEYYPEMVKTDPMDEEEPEVVDTPVVEVNADAVVEVKEPEKKTRRGRRKVNDNKGSTRVS